MFGDWDENLSVICASDEKSFDGYRWGAHAARVLISAAHRNRCQNSAILSGAIASVPARAHGAWRSIVIT
jgi:hypothetical protein